MEAFFHLLGLHIGRIVRSKAFLIPAILFPVIACGLHLAGFRSSKAGAYAAFAALAVWTISSQAARDKASGLSEGIRTTPVSSVVASLARLAVLPVLFALQLTLFAVLSNIFRSP